MARASVRFPSGARARRSDAGRARLHPAIEGRLQELLGGRDRPAALAVWRELGAFCRRRGLRSPSRATVYNAMDRVAPPRFALDDLPDAVRRCLHNVGSGPVPGQQIVFAAFNYGDTRALTFASGMPWSCLHRAAQMPGFRAKSASLLRAAIAYREGSR